MKIEVDKEIYELVKEGRINMVFLDEDLEQQPDQVKVVHGKGSVLRQVSRMDHVNQGYLGKGYPRNFVTTSRKTRLHIDMVIPKNDEDAAKATA